MIKSNIFNIPYIGALVTISICSLNSHVLFPIPPTVLYFILGFILLLFMGFKKYIYIKKNELIFIAYPIFLFFTQFYTDAPFRRMVGPIISILFFILSIFFLRNLSYSRIKNVIKYFINISILVLLLDTIFRLYKTGFDISSFNVIDNPLVIYKYKFSYLYADTNGVAIHALVILFFVMYYEKYLSKKLVIQKLILYFIIITTISRAAYLGTFIGLIYFYLWRNKPIKYKITVSAFLLFFIFYFLIFYVFPFFQDDLSLQQRFNIIDETIGYFKSDNSLFTLLFLGTGFSMSESVLGIYAHNYWLVSIIESGIVSTIVLVSIWVFFIKNTNKEAFVVIIPLFITTLSSNFTFAPFLYVSFALMYYLENIRIDDINTLQRK